MAAYSGCTHGADVPSEHLETDLRTRLGIAGADPGWAPAQLPVLWGDDRPRMERKLAALRTRLLGGRPRSGNGKAKAERPPRSPSPEKGAP